MNSHLGHLYFIFFFPLCIFISTGSTTINTLPAFISPRKYGFTLYTIMISISSYHNKSLYGYYLSLVKGKVVGWGYFHTHKPVPKMKIHLIFDRLHLRLPIDSWPSPLSWWQSEVSLCVFCPSYALLGGGTFPCTDSWSTCIADHVFTLLYPYVLFCYMGIYKSLVNFSLSCL